MPIGKRGSRSKSRELRRLNSENAHRAILGLTRRSEIFGLTKGQFSLIDLIRAILDKTGPADLVISTWTAAKKEIEHARVLLKDGRVRSIRWLVDFSFPRRQPGYCEDLRAKFGDECIRVTKNHAKFAIFRSAEWSIVLRGSMNLNQNPRLEYFEICHDPAMADFLLTVVDEVFEVQGASEGFTRRPIENVEEFEKFGKNISKPGPSPFGADLSDPMAPGFTSQRRGV